MSSVLRFIWLKIDVSGSEIHEFLTILINVLLHLCQFHQPVCYFSWFVDMSKMFNPSKDSMCHVYTNWLSLESKPICFFALWLLCLELQQWSRVAVLSVVIYIFSTYRNFQFTVFSVY
jgi:hypothetical protein